MIDRLRPAYSPGSMTCLLAIAPGGHHCRHARLGVDKYAGLGTEVAGAFADSKGRYGYRRIKAVLKTGVSEKVVRSVLLQCLFDRFGSVFPQCGLMVFPGVVIVSR